MAMHFLNSLRNCSMLLSTSNKPGLHSLKQVFSLKYKQLAGLIQLLYNVINPGVFHLCTVLSSILFLADVLPHGSR